MDGPNGHDSDLPDEDGEVVRTEVNWSSSSPVTGVVETVAVAADRDPTEMEPLQERVDAEALNSLVRSDGTGPGGEVHVSFVFAEHLVSVHGTGEIVVRPAEAEG